jgi:1-deoxy-D-xylulose-5-phosphate reductoisomerase
VGLAREAGERSGSAAAVLNAANEEAVELFLNGQCQFTDIIPTVQRTLEAMPAGDDLSVEGLLAADRWARSRVRALMERRDQARSKLPA